MNPTSICKFWKGTWRRLTPPTQHPNSLIDVFSVLLAQAKEKGSDNPVLATIEPVEHHGLGMSINAGGLRGLTEQILTALAQ